MKDSGKDIQDNMQNNIIPKLQKELEGLREKFEKQGDGDKLEPLEKKLKNLTEV